MEFSLSTPFGDRALSVEMIEGQRLSASCNQDVTADKWQILRDLTDCREDYVLSDRAVAVLSALLSFHQEDKLSADDNLIVFPSNRKLCARAHGISEPTLRRHLASLVKAGLLVRRDSPNGKRFARRGDGGSVLKAFGFDLRPLLAQAARLGELAEIRRAERRLRRSLREDITLMRRNFSKGLVFALEQGQPGPWLELERLYVPLNQRTDRSISLETLKSLHGDLCHLLEDLHKALEKFIFSRKVTGNDAQTERHKQDSNPDSLHDIEIGFPTENHEGSLELPSHQVFVDRLEGKQFNQTIGQWEIRKESAKGNTKRKAIDPGLGNNPTDKGVANDFPEFEQKSALPLPPNLERRLEASLDLTSVLMACSKINHCHRVNISSWGDLIEAAETARAILGISPAAWMEAQSQMGLVAASVTVAAILERSDDIRSPGGYLRALTGKEGFTPIPMIQALVNQSGQASGARSGGQLV